jgi:hypothetical protein
MIDRVTPALSRTGLPDQSGTYHVRRDVLMDRAPTMSGAMSSWIGHPRRLARWPDGSDTHDVGCDLLMDRAHFQVAGFNFNLDDCQLLIVAWSSKDSLPA